MVYMFVPAKVIDWFTSLKNAADTQAELTREALSSLREELAAVRAERDALRIQSVVNETNFDWLRAKINSLELERATLIEKAYGIKLPVPELTRSQPPNMSDPEFAFEDIGEDVAKALGLPTYSDQ